MWVPEGITHHIIELSKYKKMYTEGLVQLPAVLSKANIRTVAELT